MPRDDKEELSHDPGAAGRPDAGGGAGTSGLEAKLSGPRAALRSIGSEKGERGKGADSSAPEEGTAPGLPASRKGTARSEERNRSMRGAASEVWLAAGASARDWANANGEAEPADAPPNERYGTEEGTPLVGMSGEPKGGGTGTAPANAGAEG